MNLLNNIKHIPDRLFVLLRENFGYSGQMTRRSRDFRMNEKSNLYTKERPKDGKRLRIKKIGTNRLIVKKDRKSLNNIF